MRVQWREWRGTAKTPSAGAVHFEDNHDKYTAAHKVTELLESGAVCWVYIERHDITFKGSSIERPKGSGK